MSVVYVLGAGFSKDYNPKVLPLLGDFLAVAAERDAYRPLHEHRSLASVLHRYFGSEYPDLERALSFLGLQELPDPFLPPEKKRAHFDDLVQVIKKTLGHAYKYPASEETQKLYQNFAQHAVESDSTVITFNYDVIIDNLLSKTHKWSPITGYGVPLPQSCVEPDFARAAQPASTEGRSPLLLKLHGSVNWGCRSIPDPVTGNDFFVWPGFFDIEYELIDSKVRKIRGDWPIATIEDWGDTGRGYSYSYKCVIVPPAASKSDVFATRFLLNVWYIARETLRNARKIVFIGYSLPRTDFLFEALLTEAIGASNVRMCERTIEVVNPDQTPACQAKQLFQGATVSWKSQRTIDFLKNLD